LLTHVLKYKNRKTFRLDHKFRVAEIYGAPVGAYGYFITLAAAKKLLDNLYPVWAVADDWAVFNKRYISVKALVPYCIGLSEHDKVSNLEDERKDIKLKRGIGYHFYQFFYHKFINQIFVRPFQRVVKQEKTW
jgi:glycosyl transferase family 25